jgi:hypothetical protein
MVKHIIGMGIYMISVMYLVLFGGEQWIPEPDERFFNPYNPGFVYPGRP